MNKTQTVIIFIGDERQLRLASEVLSGFKAVTILRELTSDKVRNVFKHNKNVVHLVQSYNIRFHDYDPVILNLTYGKSNFETRSISVDTLITDFPDFMDQMDIDVGDHISEDSGISTSQTSHPQASCLMCQIWKGVSPRKEHILYKTQNFYVVPGLGGFFEGYLMIVPKEHVMSFAELSKETFDEFKLILSDIKSLLEAIYGKKVFVFECGSGKGGAGKHATSIVHAHFHLAPTDMPVFESICKSGLNPSQMDINTLFRYGEYPYMLYGTQDDEWYICSDPDSYFPRQHPRQILADYMGLTKGEYNWRTHPYEEEMEVTAAKFTDFVVNNFQKFPKWTQVATMHLL